MRAPWQLNIHRLVGDEHGRKNAIAKAAGMSPQQFSDLINKSGRNPQLRQLERIANAIGVQLADVFRTPDSSAFASPGDFHARSATPIFDPGDPARVEAALRIALHNVLTDLLAGLAPREDA